MNKWFSRGIILVLSVLVGIAAYVHLDFYIQAYRFPPPGQMVDVGGYYLHLNCAGKGEVTVILDSDMGGTSIDWTVVQNGISAFAPVCSFDRAGLGWSDASLRRRTSEVMVEELRQLLKNADIKPPYILVGHGFGGLNMQLFACKYPKEVAGLVLVDSIHPDHLELISANIVFSERLRGWVESIYPYHRVLWTKLHALNLSEEMKGFPEEVKKIFKYRMTDLKNYRTMMQEAEFFIESLRQIKGSNCTFGNIPLIVISSGQKFGSQRNESEFSEDEIQNFEVFNQRWDQWQQDLVGKSKQGRRVIAYDSDHLIPWLQPEIVVESVRQMIL